MHFWTICKQAQIYIAAKQLSRICITTLALQHNIWIRITNNERTYQPKQMKHMPDSSSTYQASDRRRGLPWQARATQASQGDRPQTQLNWPCNRNSQCHVGKSSLATKGRLSPPCKAPLLLVLVLLPCRWMICEALLLDTSVLIAGKGIHRMNQTAPPMPTQCISVYHVHSYPRYWLPIVEKIRLVPAGIYSCSAKVAAPGHVHFQTRWTC